MAINYTQDQVEYIVNQYRLSPTRETVEKLAEELEKSIKSIIGKLSREGVYKKTEYTTKTNEITREWKTHGKSRHVCRGARVMRKPNGYESAFGVPIGA